MVERKILWTKSFEKTIKKLKDIELKNRITKKIKKIIENPETGKPLKYALKGERTVYIKPYRIIYSLTTDKIVFLKFKHRKKVYDK